MLAGVADDLRRTAQYVHRHQQEAPTRNPEGTSSPDLPDTRATSLCVLTASIAHEVNQPLAGTVTNASTCHMALTAGSPKVELAKKRRGV